MSEFPLVSLCIPTYNAAKYLPAALKSAIRQDYPNLEILVVDDASSDQSVQIAEGFRSQFPNLRVEVNSHNLGLVPNCNRCLDLAYGDFVKFLFHDDTLEPQCVSKLVEAARDDRLVGCWRKIHFEENADPELVQFFDAQIRQIKGEWPKGLDLDGPAFASLALRNGFNHNLYGEPTAMLVHRRHWEAVGKLDPEFLQLCDLEWTLRIGAEFGFRLIPDELCTFTVHDHSITSETQRTRSGHRMAEPLFLAEKIRTHPAFRHFQTGTRNQIEFDRCLLGIQSWAAGKRIDPLSAPEFCRKRITWFRRFPWAISLTHLTIKARSFIARLLNAA